MRDIYYYEQIEQVQAISEPTRWRMLDLLVREPMTGAQIARVLGIPRTRAHYHLKVLERVGLIELTSEGIKQGIVEKYYRAIAKEFRTDRLFDRSRLLAGQDAAHMAPAVRNLMLAILDLARVDITNPTLDAELVRLGYQRQDEWYLSPEQHQALVQDLRNLGEQYAAYDSQNRPQVSQDAASFVHIRHTWLLTPVTPLADESESAPSDEQE